MLLYVQEFFLVWSFFYNFLDVVLKIISSFIEFDEMHFFLSSLMRPALVDKIGILTVLGSNCLGGANYGGDFDGAVNLPRSGLVLV
jgi:hypothetical protein